MFLVYIFLCTFLCTCFTWLSCPSFVLQFVHPDYLVDYCGKVQCTNVLASFWSNDFYNRSQCVCVHIVEVVCLYSLKFSDDCLSLKPLSVYQSKLDWRPCHVTVAGKKACLFLEFNTVTCQAISFLTEVDRVEHIWLNFCRDLGYEVDLIRNVTLLRKRKFVQRSNLFR